jgi:predicted house-cleaning noncanonical NTP pyrophosphatase (MazG superfamily)
MKQSLKIGFVALVVAAIAASGMAFAQSDGTDDTVPPAGDTQVEEFAPERGFKGRGGHHGMRGGPGHLSEVAVFLGVDAQVIQEGLEAGDTLAEIAAADGSSGTALVDSLVAGLTEKLEGAVADERIDQEKADEILADATEKITTMVNSTQEEIQALREAKRAERQAEREARQAERQQNLADVVGIPFEDIQATLADGETTLAEFAAENGNQLSLDELVEGLAAPAAADLAEKVADGTITQAEADERLADITERIADRVQSVSGDRPFGDRGDRDGRRGPGRGGPGFGGGDFAPPAVDDVSLNA